MSLLDVDPVLEKQVIFKLQSDLLRVFHSKLNWDINTCREGSVRVVSFSQAAGEKSIVISGPMNFLHVAVLRGCTEKARLALELGADPTLVCECSFYGTDNYNGCCFLYRHTPVELARFHLNAETAAQFEELLSKFQ